jgi:SOS response regulatory protein OraA/RecX
MILQKILKSRDKVKLIFEDGSNIRVSETTLAKYLLFQGKDIDRDLIANIALEDMQSDIIAACIDLISRRPRSKYEISKYLERKYKDIINNELKEQIISYLIAKSYLNDQLFCQWWIENRINFRPKSSLELAKELGEHGIDMDTARAAISQFYNNETESEQLQKLLFKKFNLHSLMGLDPKQKQKVISYFLRKGYNYELIKSTLEK